MPSHKRAASTSPPPTTKRSRATGVTIKSARTFTEPPNIQHDDSSNPFWALNASATRRVTLSTFKGKTMVDVREYYESGGKHLPGKKGISLTMEQFNVLLTIIPRMEKELVKMGEDVGRPDYGTGASTEDDGVEEEQDLGRRGDENDIEEEGQDQGAFLASTKGSGKIKERENIKKNFESTSDEDENDG